MDLLASHAFDLLGDIVPVDLCVDFFTAREPAQQIALMFAPRQDIGVVFAHATLAGRRSEPGLRLFLGWRQGLIGTALSAARRSGPCLPASATRRRPTSSP